MELKREKYKEIYVLYEVNSEGKFICSGLGFRAYKKDSSGEYWESILDAESAIHKKLDEFLNTTPKNYKDLAKHIQETLIWTGYEDCYVDEFVLKTLIENFARYRNGAIKK